LILPICIPARKSCTLKTEIVVPDVTWTTVMLAFGLGLKLLCAIWALAWAGWVLVRGQRTPLHLTWGVFTLCMGALLVAEGLGSTLGSARLWLLMLSGGTCSVFWLFTRALFRKTAAIGPFELMLVGGIIAPSVIKPVLIISGFDAPIEILVSAQTMLSSTALMLSVWEAARNWPSAEHVNERRLRIGYLAVFSSGVFLCAIVFNTAAPISPQLVTLIEALCAAAVLAIGSIAIVYRGAHPVPEWRPAPEATETDVQLGQRLIRLMDREQLYLEPDLSLRRLAQALGEPPNKVSRAITAGLKAANVNQLINARRIAHAQSLLTDPDKDSLTILQVALESGFNSIGPFNRAFKALTDQTPRDYRRGRDLATQGVAAE
jgi:AraC-like DNA-binding protein